MFSGKTLLPVAAVVVLAASVYVATRQKTSMEPAKEDAPARSSPSSPVPLAPQRNVSRERAPRDVLPGRLRNEFDLKERGYLSARRGIDAVLGGLMELESERDRESFITGAFTRAADFRPTEALEWARRLKPGASRNAALLTLLREWTGSSVTGVLMQGSFAYGGIEEQLGRHLLKSGAASPEEVIAFASDFVSSSRSHISLTAEAAGMLAVTDPARALAIGDRIDVNHRESYMRDFAKSWASHDLQGALRWMQEIPDSDSRELMQLAVMGSVASGDPANAVRSLQRMPPSRERGEMLNAIFSNWAMQDTRAALQSAKSLTDEAERDSALKSIRSTMPVGIGVQLGGNRIMRVLPGSPASRAGLAEGDQITAYTAADGQWVSVDNADVEALINGIRGAENTSVTLKVSAKDGGASRTIKVIREQIVAPGK